ncbi:MAG: MlaE family lipid ABC transporter permease subunit [Candidatus Latescibacteria bacterium]|nr:MlaE family lipid ABC transporter permease subunit [Candidatus Latescibacterota bacterium]
MSHSPRTTHHAPIVNRQSSVSLAGDVVLARIPELQRTLEQAIRDAEGAEVVLECSGIGALDSAGAALLDCLKEFALVHAKTLTLVNTPEHAGDFLSFFGDRSETSKVEKERKGIWERTGDRAVRAYQAMVDVFVLISDVLYGSAVHLVGRSGARKGAFTDQAVLLGSQALPIVGLILFLIGFITALQSAAQLRQFGANIYVADLLAIGIVCELGPLMTAIIVSGRSGSAIAAEIATMKFTEEIDALKTMGLDPIRFVVVPKFLAMTLCMPLLVVMADVIGIFGGFVVGVTYLNVGAVPFAREVVEALFLRDLLIGLFKSISFSWVIAITAAYRGLQFTGGADGVGRATTSSVVTSIFLIIVVDLFWSMVFYFGRSPF